MYSFRGKVRHGKRRGKDLGFPTANVRLHKKIPEGIYISQVKLDSQFYPALTFIGPAIQFGERDYKAETYLLNFSQDIYNRWMSVQLIKKIRDNKKFESVEKLVKQMEKDKKAAQEYFRSND